MNARDIKLLETKWWKIQIVFFFNITYDVLYHFVEFEIKSQLILGEKYQIFFKDKLDQLK